MERGEQLGKFTLYQQSGCFPLGGETLALGAFATVRRGFTVCDLGCGSGALGLLLLERAEGLRLTGVELDPQSARLAQSNYERNGIAAQIITGDLRDKTLLPAGQFELVVSNPPWFPVGSGASGGPARMEERCSLREVCATAGRLLKNGGRFAVVHRPERLAEVFAALREAGLEPKRMQCMQHDEAAPPSAILLESIRQGKPGLTILPPHLASSKGVSPQQPTHPNQG